MLTVQTCADKITILRPPTLLNTLLALLSGFPYKVVCMQTSAIYIDAPSLSFAPDGTYCTDYVLKQSV